MKNKEGTIINSITLTIFILGFAFCLIVALLVFFNFPGIKAKNIKNNQSEKKIEYSEYISDNFSCKKEIFYNEDQEEYYKVKLLKYTGEENTVDIPRKIDGEEVYSIGNACFSGSNIKKVKINGNIEEIESFAFYNCKNLKEVSFYTSGNGLTIKDSAFMNCTSLSSLSFPYLDLLIEDKAFENCSSLKEIKFVDDCNLIIERRSFYGTGIEEVNLPQNTEEIGELAFGNCYNLKERITIPYGCTTNGDIQKKTRYYYYKKKTTTEKETDNVTETATTETTTVPTTEATTENITETTKETNLLQRLFPDFF